MTVATAVPRVAGKVLGEFLSLTGKDLFGNVKALGSAAEQAVSKLPLVQKIASGTPEYAAKAIVSNPLLSRAAAVIPAPVSAWQTGATVLPQAVGGLTTLGGTLAGYKALSELSKRVDDRSTRTMPFATQQYIPGTLPMTNEQMGDALLNQQRYMQQMQLIQARNMASQPQAQVGIPGLMESIGQTYSFD